ncbi:hypothetical protein [Bdellovibrio svalbardensis]|uniref:Uncharacterized protein n=1 Tax=Bdellovibrio svalbardensis TaxID=2972972 RepID=A0ABT6DKK5_9BACT|nr:hypothetical protein [Bdellovibrio svalbardensis]MDG0817394.1 hypothetical protein [Bdellovibrio svalbardensis]
MKQRPYSGKAGVQAALTVVLGLFIATSAWARGPVDPISPPWPVSISTMPLEMEDLPGEWVAYSHNTIWFIQIEMNANGRGLAAIHIQSNAVRTHKVDGWLAFHKNSLAGEILFDGHASKQIMIFRDSEGTKLRISAPGDRYYDLKLYKRH